MCVQIDDTEAGGWKTIKVKRVSGHMARKQVQKPLLQLKETLKKFSRRPEKTVTLHGYVSTKLYIKSSSVSCKFVYYLCTAL